MQDFRWYQQCLQDMPLASNRNEAYCHRFKHRLTGWDASTGWLGSFFSNPKSFKTRYTPEKWTWNTRKIRGLEDDFLFQKGVIFYVPCWFCGGGNQPQERQYRKEFVYLRIGLKFNKLTLQSLSEMRFSKRGEISFLLWQAVKSGESRRSSWVKIKRINGIQWATSGNFPGLFDDFWSLESSSGGLALASSTLSIITNQFISRLTEFCSRLNVNHSCVKYSRLRKTWQPRQNIGQVWAVHNLLCDALLCNIMGSRFTANTSVHWDTYDFRVG